MVCSPSWATTGDVTMTWPCLLRGVLLYKMRCYGSDVMGQMICEVISCSYRLNHLRHPATWGLPFARPAAAPPSFL